MKPSNRLTLALTRLLLIGSAFGTAGTHAAANNSVEGVVTNVNPTAQTITIREDRNQSRHTYFVAQGTRISVAGESIDLQDIKRGNTVALRYRATDKGREIEALDISDGDEIVEILAVEFDEERLMEGVITGVRKAKRTITIRDRETRQRRTIKVPESARIVREGQEIRLRQLQVGDEVNVRYRVTDLGLILVTAAAPAPLTNSDEDDNQYAAALPKTAGVGYWWLIAALFSGFGAFSLRTLRRLRLR